MGRWGRKSTCEADGYRLDPVIFTYSFFKIPRVRFDIILPEGMEEYQLSTSEYAKRERVSAMTICRWKAKGAPLDDPEAMRVFRANEHSRNGISKSNHRRTSSSRTSYTSSCTPSQPELLKETKTDPLRIEVEKHMGIVGRDQMALGG